VLSRHKVLIFTEFMDTARYLQNQLQQVGLTGVAEIDSSSKADRREIIRRFAPYYNGSSSAALAAEGLEGIRILISTDVLSEGLNLQDATRLINYDLHWNPVRLMQRIGRVDRRMNPDIEANIIADHPDQKEIRGTAAYWNFLPPDELDSLLRLYKRVSHKTLRISRVFGIEGKKLLRPEDDYQALKDFIQAADGAISPLEAMRLEYRQLLNDNPGLADQLSRLPNRIFSGKVHPEAALAPNARAIFFCYVLPAAESDNAASAWTEAAGFARWYLYDLTNDKIAEEATEIVNIIRSAPSTPRARAAPTDTLADIRAKVERHIKNTHFKKVQAPSGVKPVLRVVQFEWCALLA
jgi:superfamily II DNA/RNA helicase